jgi:methyl-accepting chemotaxis protein
VTLEQLGYAIQALMERLGLRTIRRQFQFSFILTILFAFISGGVIWLNMSSSADAINVAGRQRMLSQRVAQEALLVKEGAAEPAQVRKTVELFERSHAALLEGSESMGLAGVQDPEIRQQLRDVRSLWQDYKDAVLAVAEDPDSAAMQRVSDMAPEILSEMDAAVDMMAARARAETQTRQWVSLAMIIAIVLLIGVDRNLGIRNLLNHVDRLRDRLTALSRGDFSQTLTVERADDEIGQIYTAYNEITRNQGQILASIREQSQELSTSSERLSDTAEEISRSGQSSSEGVGQVLQSAQEVNQVVQDVANNIQSVSDAAHHSTESTQKGKEAVDQAAQRLGQLKETTGRVDEIIASIDNIAKKTDLLALNAAIEAANAGEAGQGFAVVADEVRKLADQTSQATSLVSSIMGEVQTYSDDSVSAMDQVQAQMDDLLNSIEHTDQSANQIASAAEELAATMSETTDSMSEISGNVEQVAASVDEIKTAADQLGQMAASLQEQVRQYRLG